MTTSAEWEPVEMPEGSATPWLALAAGAVFAVVVLVVYGRFVKQPGSRNA